MEKIVALAASVPFASTRNDDDVIDRLSHRYTSIILVVFAVIHSANQYIGDPITCWSPAEFHSSHVKYARSYCWVRNTYYLPFEDRILRQGDVEEKKQGEIPYYQWVPFILLAQAVFFYAPTVIWRAFNSKAGVDADNIMDAAATFAKADKLEQKEKTLGVITKQIDRFLSLKKGKVFDRSTVNFQHLLSKSVCFCCSMRFGNYLFCLFLFVKVLFITNAFSQLFILNSVLRTDYNVFGLEVLRRYTNWSENTTLTNPHSRVFPRVTMCDFTVRRPGNLHPYTVQCVLPLNLYTEVMYTFLWFWMVILLALSCVSLLQWVVRAVFTKNRYYYVRYHLRAAGLIDLEDQMDMRSLSDFVYEYLRLDGALILRLIGHNTNRLSVTEICASLWITWRDRQTKRIKPKALDDVDGTIMKPPYSHSQTPPPMARPSCPPPQPPVYKNPVYNEENEKFV